jgi:hypothetical protein
VARTTSSGCGALLWTAIIFMLVGSALAVIGCILSHFFPALGVLTIIGFVIFGIGWVLFIIWLIICTGTTACSVLLDVYHLVLLMIVIFGIVAAVLAIIGKLGPGWLLTCAGIAAGAAVNWGIVSVILYYVAKHLGCIRENPGTRKARPTADSRQPAD